MIDLTKYIPELPFKMSRLLYRDTVLDQEIGQVVLRYMHATAKHLHAIGDQFQSERQLSDGNIPELVAAQAPHDGALFLVRGRWPVLLRWQVNRDSASGWILSTLPVGPTGRQIVRDALSWHALAPERSKFAIYQVDGDEYGPANKITRMVPPDRTSWYVVPEEAQDVRSTVRFWLTNQRWYQDRGMPWRMGVELEGPPGTGKSTLVKVLAQELEVPLMVISPEVLEGTRDWSDLWSKVMVETRPPIFVLIEDFDLALRPHLLEGLEDLKSVPMGHHRKRNSRSTMSSMMNLLDGVSTPDGVCFFVTTNNPEDVEQAVTRPGRIDRVVHIGVASERLREEVARRVLLGFTKEEIDRTIGEGAGETVAAFRNRCQKMALKREIG